MNKRLLAIISLLLALVMVLGVLASCSSGNNNNDETTTGKNEESSREPSVSETETNQNGDEEEGTGTGNGGSELPGLISGDNSELIELSNKLANGVNPYYTDASGNELTISNTTMDLGYNMTNANGDLLVSHLSTKDGHAYIKNTMDTFVKMRNGNTYYNGKSVTTGSVNLNIYRYGYYYYETRLEGQSFINSINKKDIKTIRISPNKNASHNIITTGKAENGNGIKYRIEGSDPYLCLEGISFGTAKYDYLEVTIKATSASGSGELYLIVGDTGHYNSGQVKSFGVMTDGEAHTYQFYLADFSDYTGSVRGIRFDIDGAIGSEVEVSDLSIYKGDFGDAPTELTAQRSFVTYSDKLHHVLQVSAKELTEDIQYFGMETKIPADMVQAIVIKDRQGLHYELSGIAWATVEYIGFDIKDAGIFGYILPYDGSGGSIRVSLDEGVYTIEQRKSPDGGLVRPSDKGTRNANDFFMGQRIYTDTNHTFDTFIHEAECERNPLTEENVIIDTTVSDSGGFSGYDALYGYYKITLAGTGFNQAYYKYPNKHYTLKFKIVGDKYDRQMYFMSYTPNGGLETAVLLDDKQLALPIPLEVAKNFCGDGEANIYNLDDAVYGETYFPMIVKSGETKEYTLLNLYQNWGKYPLKQISSIQFHVPYYHLSTGVTETNCIVPFSVCGPGLPDHRTMSAPLWRGQPQHTSGGGHSWLRYNDSTGLYIDSQTTGVKIDSYGPIYSDITLDWITSDGKMAASYTHIEMPQTDENRAFYELRYTVLEDLFIPDFKNNFTFYYCTDNNSTGSYKKIGYLNENNECTVVDASTFDVALGDNCPYVSFFMMPDWNRESTSAEGYTNLSILFKDYEVKINGEKVETRIYLHGRGGSLSLSLDLGDVEFKKGDTISINAILMPWGSQELEDDPANRFNSSHTNGYTEYTYNTVLPDGTLYMDKNVRDVRENTLLNPLKATADKDCEVIESAFVPKVRSTNGKTAEFTISGGYNNCAVRVYGFNTLSAPKIEEFVDGEWKELVISSKDTQDAYGYFHYYDGYSVHYDGDGTYSYSFISEMDKNGTPRKFRMTVDESFEGWPEIVVEDDVFEDPINHFLQPSEIQQMAVTQTQLTDAMLAPGKKYISLSGNSAAPETYVHFFNNDMTDLKVTGQYVAIKYRLPSGISTFAHFEIFASTTTTAATGDGDRLEFSAHFDDKWHIVIIDVSTLKNVEPNANGEYALNFARWDLLNGKVSSSMYIDVAYFGIHSNLEDIFKLELDKEKVPTETPAFVEFIQNGTMTKLDPKTGEPYVAVYVDPENEQGYKLSEVEYVAWIDYINKSRYSFSMHDKKQVVEIPNPTKQTIGDGLLVLTGWSVADGGIEKYVWSSDGGKTWHDVVMYNDIPLLSADDAMIAAYGSIKAYKDADGNEIKPTVTDVAASKANGGFSGSKGICANLADFYETGSIVNVTFAAVPKADTSSLCIIGHITNVEVYVAPPIAPNETVNLPLTPEYIYNKVTSTANTFASSILSEDKSVVKFVANSGGDQYAYMMNGNTQHTGQYLFIKYRIPHGEGCSNLTAFEIFTSTVNQHFVAGDNFTINVTQDGEWHVVIVDVSQKLSTDKFGRNGEGRYVAKYLRLDVFEQQAVAGMYAEFSAMGFADNLDVIYNEYCSDMEYVTVIGSDTTKVDPKTGAAYVKNYIDPENAQGYTKTTVEYAGWLDMVNGKGGNHGTANNFGIRVNHNTAITEFSDHCGTPLEGTQLLTLTGWFVANGGVEKYVWSADGGKTWHDVEFYINNAAGPAGDAHLQQLEETGAVITDLAATKQNCVFQGSAGKGAATSGIAANLKDFAGQKVNVVFAAVPKADTNSLCILIEVVGVQVPVIEAE